MNIVIYKVKHTVLGQYASFSLLSGILLLSVFVPPFHQGNFTVCVFKNIFGVPGAGCGMTRAFLFLGHGNIHEAVSLNINSPLAFAIVVFLWACMAVKIFIGKEVRIRLMQLEKLLLYLASASFMIIGWMYNLFFNPYV
ncbi:MAG: DUF2752 domain-containing protein [Deltaproteobacteria bacterium]|nr:DUF2752 domain-containing protein [Deltaproteobacteria bacterium]